MSALLSLKSFVQQRLSAAVEEICEHVARTISEYEEELIRNNRLNNRAELRAADIQQLLETKEEVPPKQPECSSSLDQEDPAPLPSIKEEQEELWSGLEGEQLQKLEEVDRPIISFRYDEGEAQPPSPLLQRDTEPPAGSSAVQMKTEPDGGECGGSEPASDFDANTPFEPSSEDATWRQNRDPLSGLKALKNNIVNDTIVVRLLESEGKSADAAKSFSCARCDKSFNCRATLNQHMKCHPIEKEYSCLVCQRPFRWRMDFVSHLRTHTGEKPFVCGSCGKRFRKHGMLKRHTRTHTGERPHLCSVCGNGFRRKEDLTKHTWTHTGEKPFFCGVCHRRFSRLFRLKNHKCLVGSGGT